jgi:hypothetical protein
MPRWLALAVCCSAVAALAYSPQYLEDKKKECTFLGTVDQACVDLYTDIVAGSNAEHIDRSIVDRLRTCFDQAAGFERKLQDHSEAAVELLVRQSANEPEATNRYVAGCIDVTARLRGPAWLTAARQQAVYAALKAEVNRSFEEKCGLRGDLASGDPPSLVLWSKPKKSSVFYEGLDAAGGKLTVLCNGVVQGKTKQGKAWKVAARNIGEVREAQARGCRSNCEMNDSMCVESFRRGRVTPKCVAYCKEKCQ